MKEFLLWLCYSVLVMSSYFTVGIIFSKITDCFVDIKKNKIFKLVIFVGLSAIPSVVIIVSDVVNVIYALIAYIAIMLICYEGSAIKRISVVMVFYPIIVSFNLFGYNFIKKGYFPYPTIWSYILILFWFVIYKVMKNKILYAKQYINDKTWILIDIICIAPLISIVSMDDMDLCSIFANTLDNAIEASLKIKDLSQRKITIKARTNKGYFSYSITNKKDQHILTHKKTIISSKSDIKHHGFGLQNLKDIVNKYKGNLDISYNDTQFSVVVIIKVY
ncbi:ATP-binding protein [Clostridium sporogenes]|uniref:ATP-binding protein n=1 Tax=Clostridium sporogenes TaxID=1509 RepID=UPI00223822A3|nr:ATP-binding protein [Clostridium sporogenes]EKS4342345.1 sensor histidine kinase [Clostridium botulinum]EKS4393812.1 sensor histidine kinase [Clostridium botulinum]MCW6080006.1 ATP-binding protein [Clostridium sporogenes]